MVVVVVEREWRLVRPTRRDYYPVAVVYGELRQRSRSAKARIRETYVAVDDDDDVAGRPRSLRISAGSADEDVDAVAEAVDCGSGWAWGVGEEGGKRKLSQRRSVHILHDRVWCWEVCGDA